MKTPHGPQSASSLGDASPLAHRTGATARVTGLWIYPLKGARAVALNQMELDQLGPAGDRRWMITRSDGNFVSQRDVPELARVTPTLLDDELRLESTANPGLGRLTLARECRGPTVQARLHGSVVSGCAVGPKADRWLSEALGIDARLVFMRDSDTRRTDPAYAPNHRVSFADAYPALLVSQASVQELARRAGRAIPVERFRPNIVVTAEYPHAEDRWQRFSVGGVSFRGVKISARCVVTTTDQETGARDPDNQPLRALALYRRIESSVYFGVNVVHLGPGRIRVGDEVCVQERGWIPGEVP